MAAKKKAKRPFKPGDKCNRKAAPHCRGVIIRAVALLLRRMMPALAAKRGAAIGGKLNLKPLPV
jgi:hypothetical protein